MRFVSYNLRFASENDPQPWSRRRGPQVELIDSLAPDVLGVEEGLDHQLADLMAGLDDHYRLIAEHRRDGGPEENSAIIYNGSVVELIKVEHQWLSDTPDAPGSITWGSSLPRMYSLATFRRIADDVEFFVISTHFDHELEIAQINSARQLRNRISALDPERGLVLMGDFNCGEDSEPYAILTGRSQDGAGLRDAYLTAADRGPRLGTFNNYAAPDPDGIRIDWILINDRMAARSSMIVDQAPGGQYPSDHLPVLAEIDF
ncbi:endonuclease [Microlunatus endophyticus]|uniref:Endonuclease n=1 Tax=Microlunatus endophyticus TaxID=1716077 RepID=A0A917S3H7_9ACTN|nr:endonuclease/exonuclease/phosphatase family protein [Microlunatus endophyticus]GGL55390.1 endonuclease [Microlunatus endophyticus]